MDLSMFIIHKEFDYFHNFRNFILTSIENERVKKSLSWEEFKKGEGKNLDTTEQEYDYYVVDAHEEINETEQLFYKSYTVSIFMFLERQFADLCSFIKENQNLIFGYKDLRGNGIQRYVNYIEKTLEQPFPNIKHLNNKFRIALIVRNTIVHTNGELDSSRDKEEIIKYVKKESKNLTINNKRLLIKQEYIENLTGTAQGICGEINQIRKLLEKSLT